MRRTARWPRTMVLGATWGALTAADWPRTARDLGPALDAAHGAERTVLLERIASVPGADGESVLARAVREGDGELQREVLGLIARYRIGALRGAALSRLDDAAAATRAASLRALAVVGDAGSAAAIARSLGDGDPSVRTAAVACLGAIGAAQATVPLLDRLADNESTVRVAAARVLGELHDRRAVLSLLAALQDPVPEVRAAVVSALGALGDVRALAAIRAALRDVQPEVRRVAVRAVALLGSRESAVDLASLALGETGGGDPDVRIAITRASLDAIARLGGPEGARALLSVIGEAGEASDLLAPAARALVTLGPDARSAVAGFIANEPRERLVARVVPLVASVGGDAVADWLLNEATVHATNAVGNVAFWQALGSTGHPRALRLLLATLDRPATDPRAATAVLAGLVAYAAANGSLDAGAYDPLAARLALAVSDVRPTGTGDPVATLASLLGETRNASAAAPLARLLDSPVASRRAAAARALVRCGIAGVEARVVEALGDEESAVRLAAMNALVTDADPQLIERLLARRADPRPVDRGALARVLGAGTRARDPRVLAALRSDSAAASPALRDALADAFVDAVAAGDTALTSELVARASDERRAPAAIGAIGNALAVATDPSVRAGLSSALAELSAASHTDLVRASAAWALGATDDAHLATLVALADDPSVRVRANALGALAGIARDRLPDALATRACARFAATRDAVVRTNALELLARLHATCADAADGPLVERALSPMVRLAALHHRTSLETDPAAGARARARCAASERDPTAAARCAAVPPSTLTDSVDVRVDAPDEHRPAALTDCVVWLGDGRASIVRTDTGGWLHVRAAPRGDYVVYAWDSLAPER